MVGRDHVDREHPRVTGDAALTLGPSRIRTTAELSKVCGRPDPAFARSSKRRGEFHDDREAL